MKRIIFLLSMSLFLIIGACKKDPINGGGGDNNNSDYGMGLFLSDNLDSIPQQITFGFGDGNLPSSFDLLDKFPPIGNQGQYGTCVSWAVGYNGYTAGNAIERNLSKSDLSNPQNQFSPKYLFTLIPDADKGADCNGTWFEHAYDVIQKTGIATMAAVPYDNMGNCNKNTADPAWNQNAGHYKYEYWRLVDPSIAAIKRTLYQNVPVVFGAKLADNFMQWDSDAVISSSTFFDKNNQHGLHAMALAGWDDSKGPNGAFRVVNSWGTTWGDYGYIWVDYNFFLNEFIIDLRGNAEIYMGKPLTSDTPPDDDPNPQPSTEGVDLASWVFYDMNYTANGNPRERVLGFNLYNVGNKAASSSANFESYYIYYNAYNANDYGILFYDQFNQSVPAGNFNCPTADHCIINATIGPQDNLANVLFNDVGIDRTYVVPNITGYYYFVYIADATDVFREQDEMNNFFFTSTYPVYVQNGYALKNGSPTILKDNYFDKDMVSLKKADNFRTPKMKNAYTRGEISALLKAEKENGNLDSKLNHFNKVSEDVMSPNKQRVE